tara:strand:+ start:6089 stop:6316 length:228 start_codon:yes stop_codon:yes gene_type:complete
MREFTNNEGAKVQFLKIPIDELDFLNNYEEPKQDGAPQPVQQAQQNYQKAPVQQNRAPQSQSFAKPQANANPFQL